MTLNRFLRTIKKDFEGVLNHKMTSKEVNSILNTTLDNVRGHDFYKVLVLISSNFDQDCERALSEIAEEAKKKYLAKHKEKTKTTKSKNRIQLFINQFTTLQLDIAEKACIENTRFTKVLNLKAKDFYAYEVYLIAMSQGISAKSAFEQLYEE